MVEKVARLARYTSAFLAAVLLWGAAPTHARGLKTGSLIRDSQVEAALHDFAAPLFEAAGLDPEKMHLYVILDPELNAFATTRYSIFVNTGLILRAKDARELIGVLAHETGHIAAGHIARREEMMKKATAIAMATALLGGAAIAAGGGDAGAGILTGGMQMAENAMMHYSRGQEASADQAAVRFLNRLHWPVVGLQSFMKVLASQELLSSAQQDPYSRSHPLSQDRVALLERATIDHPDGALPPSFEENFERMRMKLHAFIDSPETTLRTYARDDSDKGRFMRATALFLIGRGSEALGLARTLTSAHPRDAAYWDLEGQIAFESGHIEQAVHAYGQAVSLRPKDALLRMLCAQAMLEGAPNHYPEAQKHLERSLLLEPDNPSAWRFLAVAYGKQHNTAMAALCLAEEAVCVEQYQAAYDQAGRALKSLKSKEARLRASDIRNMAENELKQSGRLRTDD